MEKSQTYSYVKLIKLTQVGILFMFLLMISFGLPFFNFICNNPYTLTTYQANLCYQASENNQVSGNLMAIVLLVPINGKLVRIMEVAAPSYYPLSSRFNWLDNYNKSSSIILKKFIDLGGNEYSRCFFLENTKVKITFIKNFGMGMSIKYIPLNVWFDGKLIMDERYYESRKRYYKIFSLVAFAIFSFLFVLTYVFKMCLKKSISSTD